MDHGFIKEVTATGKRKGVAIVVDASGEPLLEARDEELFLWKASLSKLTFIAGEKDLQPENAILFCNYSINDGDQFPP